MSRHTVTALAFLKNDQPLTSLLCFTVSPLPSRFQILTHVYRQ